MKIVLTYFPYNIFEYVLDKRAKIEWYRNKNHNKTCFQNNHFLGSHTYVEGRKQNN